MIASTYLAGVALGIALHQTDHEINSQLVELDRQGKLDQDTITLAQSVSQANFVTAIVSIYLFT